jgi:hypothetical protein
MARRVLGRGLMMLITGLAIAPVCEAIDGAPEYRVKAAFVYKFATYIRWPPPVAGEVTAPFLIGVLGNDPFGTSLNDVVRGQTVRGRVIRVRALRRAEEALACDLVFVSSSEQSNLAQILALLRTAPVLTVGDLDHFAEQGGMVGLVTTADNHIRFDINNAAIERAGLRASSQLLQLARIVVEARGGNR